MIGVAVGERHTRQGLARGQRERADYDAARDHGSHDATNAREATARPRRTTARVLGALGGCWCGDEHAHDWPGKAAGAPHPRA